ncbi:MAG TPA: UDP-N-acetylglucosamine--N-acetylmuramyl-(pentapeptide) pyrophosphoryl-undecaprenol N-acetylglucosamine transferase [Candidatus Saccharimonadales bacterium]|nr:UDP-N-acetylglucosamine--N-acetylmuramyl-(pentapeptide) pyrophosphoryl-undecaprenol N-acetylglucosamine transferase [Candidatus Saccharimonadales bacterium]
MKQQAPTVILTGGGSGGHVVPLLSLAQELKSQNPDCQIVYIGNKGDGFDTFQKSSHDFDFIAFIKAGKFRRYDTLRFAKGFFYPDIFIKNIRDFLKFPGSVIASARILRKFRPQVVFSKGSFVALPVAVAARLLGIPVVTHDSDTVPGLANRLIGRWAAIHATGMPAEFYDYPKHSTFYVGIPIDPGIRKVTPKIQKNSKLALGLPAESKVLLVSGGSGGAVQINKLMLQIAPELLQNDLSVHLLHITGRNHEEPVRDAYGALAAAVRKRVTVIGYSDNFAGLAAAADLVITRAGANTMAELAAAARPCIVIPSPHLASGHQLKNAESLARADAAAVAPADVTADELMVMIKSLLDDDKRRFELARNLYATAKPDASRELAALILKVAAGRRV